MFCNKLDFKVSSKKELKEDLYYFENKLKELEKRKPILIKENKFNDLKDYYNEMKEDYLNVADILRKELKEV